MPELSSLLLMLRFRNDIQVKEEYKACFVRVRNACFVRISKLLRQKITIIPLYHKTTSEVSETSEVCTGILFPGHLA